MKNYKRIEFKKSAEKFLKSRPRKEQVRILSQIYKLPSGNHIKKMEGYDNRYRLRIGDFRVIYELHADGITLVVLVVEIGNRGDVYK
jgi:mRNA interferase RelE/StbE